MALTLDVNGKKTESPNGTDIACGFESIDKRTGFSKALSLVILSRDGENSLITSGHPVEGWGALIYEADGISNGADISKPITQEKIIQIFQSYGRGDDLWKIELTWETLEKPGGWRILIWIAVGVVLLFLGRKFLK
jgi:hypothetical protein